MKTIERNRDQEEALRSRVRSRYGQIAGGARRESAVSACAESCCSESTGMCGPESSPSVQLGYSEEQLSELPEGSDLGLGCGNPTAIASLRPGETVLDLGSGAGIDCFLASKRVGAAGKVIGVDMTPEMVEKARKNARLGGYANVDFRLGEIEHLPVSDRSVDVILSNCVINLAFDKRQVYREAFRVLKPGGRLAIFDVVATRPVTAAERANPDLWSSCSSGALDINEVRSLLHALGFSGVRVQARSAGPTPASLEGQEALGIVSAEIRAIRPREK